MKRIVVLFVLLTVSLSQLLGQVTKVELRDSTSGGLHYLVPLTRFGGATFPNVLVRKDSNSSNGGGFVTPEKMRLHPVTNGASYATSPADKPPNTVNAYNDEFDGGNGTLPDTTSKWKFLGTNANKNLHLFFDERQGGLFMSDTAKTSGNFQNLIGQKLTAAADTAFTITVHLAMSYDGSAYTWTGIFVYDSTTSKGNILRITSDNTSLRGQFLVANSFTSQTDGSDLLILQQWSIPTEQYLRIEKTTAKALNFYKSKDGITWALHYSTTSTAFIETAGNKINWVGIVVGNNSTGAWNGQSLFYWFRYNWTADFDPTVNY